MGTGIHRRMSMSESARRVVVATLIVLALVTASKALWRLQELLALLFIAFTLAAAMRPGIEWLNRHRIPRGVGLALHYIAILGVVLLLLWLVVPPAVHQVDAAVNGNALGNAAKSSTGVKHDILVAIQKRLNHLPKAGTLIHHGVGIVKAAVSGLIGALFVFASAAYSIFERDNA